MSVADPIRRILRPLRRRDWVEVVSDYLARPLDHWGEDAPRHAEKLEQKKGALRRRDGLDDAALIDEVIGMAARRRELRPAPIYIAGLGGSGSHWLAAMLHDAGNLVSAGEVYVPRTVLEDLSGLSDSDQAAAIDAIHLLHAWPRSRDVWALGIINCAAGVRKLEQCKRWFPNAVAVHLTRDPRDQVLSVALRKPGYRAYRSPDLTDDEYLDQMIQRNVAAWREYRAHARHIDINCRYETLCEDPRPVLRETLTALGHPLDAERIDAAVVGNDAATVRAGRGSTASNLDEGGGPSRPWHQVARPDRQRMLHANLADVIHGLGYPPGDCMGSHLPDGNLPARTFAFPSGPPGPLYQRIHGVWERLAVGRGPVEVAAGTPVLLRVGSDDAGDLRGLRDCSGEDVQALCLAGNVHVDDQALTHLTAMTGLQTLDLARTGITDAALAHVEELSGLQQVTLARTATTAQGRARLARRLPQLTIWT